jgi:ATP-dependent exoDNAse (exonuclease V) beta subunit
VLAAAAHDEQAVLPLLVRLPLLSSSLGKADNWSARVAEVRAACAAAEEARQAAIDLVRAPVLADLLARLGRFTLASATERAAEGRLSFHDLLVRARRLLRHDAGARAVLRARYRWLLVDEFQDTDPIQVDLAGWLASAVEGDGGFDRARPGALFVVGDPKQSIYRFRRADIALFEQVCADVGDEVVLSASFRSVPGIVRFVNTVFPSLFGGDPQPGQARYHALEPIRGPLPQGVRRGGVQLTLAGMGPDEPEPPGLGLPPVVVLGGPLDASIGEVRRLGASEVATALHRAVAQSWPVSDPDDPSALPRALRWRDVAVLIPARNFLPALEEAFDDAGIPFRLEGAALLWGADDVRDVLGTLAAADEPSDALSVLAALRSPGLACGDDDLVAWHAAGGSWDPRAPAPDAMDGHPVARAMAVLLELHRRRWWSDPSEMVTAAADALGSYALAFAQRRPRQHWQRLRWLADQARLFDETTRGSLHDFLRWAELQREGDGRAAILGPPEADDDAVRVMTVHGAKGLEFPLVVVAGLERDDTAGYRSDAVLWGDDGAVEVGVGKHLRSAGYAAASEADRAFDRLERVRLVYVAMTRARDHLVLCLHHKARSAGTDRTHAAQLDELCRQHPLLWRRLPEADVADAPEGAGGGWGGVGDTELDDEVRRFAEEIRAWSAERAATLARLRGLPVVTATALGHGDDVVPGAVVAGGADVPEWAPGLDAVARRGAVGLEIGRAVHGALAVVDLASGTDASGRSASEVARQRAALHGVGDHADEVAAMVARALDAPAVRRAASRRHHKEVYLATALGHSDDEGVFEGFADLLVEDDDGLVVVDYKTDRIADARAFSALVERYGLQVAAYAEAAEAATGTQVVRCVLVFVGPSEVAEHVLGGDALSLARRAARNAMAQLTAAVV